MWIITILFWLNSNSINLYNALCSIDHKLRFWKKPTWFIVCVFLGFKIVELHTTWFLFLSLFFFYYQVWDETKTGWKFISILWDSVLMQGQNVFQEGEKEIKIFQVKLLVSQQQNQMAQKDIFKEMIKTTILVYS